MQKTALALACLAQSILGRRLRSFPEQSKSHISADAWNQVELSLTQSTTLGKLFCSTLNPTSAFNSYGPPLSSVSIATPHSALLVGCIRHAYGAAVMLSEDETVDSRCEQDIPVALSRNSQLAASRNAKKVAIEAARDVGDHKQKHSMDEKNNTMMHDGLLDRHMSPTHIPQALDHALLAGQLKTDGLVVVPVELRVDTQALSDACHEQLEKLLHAVDDASCDRLEQEYSFAEICHRARYRWDMRMPSNDLWNDFCENAFFAVAPILRKIAGGTLLRVEQSGVIMSRPGATEQGFHSDGDDGLYNVFVPLVDIEQDGDGTEFLAGSHMHENPMLDAAFECEDMKAQTVAPAVAAGSVLLFDFRVLHRGLASKGRERPIAYLVIATETEAEDVINFPKESVFDTTQDEAAFIPYWNDGCYHALDWNVLTAKHQRIALSTAKRLLINALRLAWNPFIDLEFDDCDLERASKVAWTMICDYCTSHELDPTIPRSQYEAATSLQAKAFHDLSSSEYVEKG